MTAGSDEAILTAPADALATLLAHIRPLGAEVVGVRDGLGRVLAEPVIAGRRVPGCDNSAMDGFAVRAADTAGAGPESPLLLRVEGEARAGMPGATLAPGTVMAIATGGPLPRHADAVVPVEQTRAAGAHVEVFAEASAGAHVRRAGDDVSPGMVMVPAGRRLRAVDLAACAAVGAATLVVHRRPRVALLGGGDELVPVEVTPAPYQVVDSNSVLLAAAIAGAGGEVVDMGVMRDDRAGVRRALAAAAACDLVVSSAGVSVGAHDHVRSVVEELGRVLVWRVAMRPGKPVLIGDLGGTCLVGLPGNPVSSAVTFEVFVRPALLALQGATEVRRRGVVVRTAEAWSTPAGLQTYVRVRLEPVEGTLPLARLSGHQGSSMLRSLSDADALVVVPAGIADVAAGTVLAALELG